MCDEYREDNTTDAGAGEQDSKSGTPLVVEPTGDAGDS